MNRYEYGLSVAALTFLVIASGTVNAAYAQPAGTFPSNVPEDPTVSDEIIVTGTKQNLTVQEVDVSVEVFDQERLDREALFELRDVLQRTPNIVSSGVNSDFTIRGIGRRGVGGAGGGVTSNVYLDGAPISNGALAFGSESVWDIEQIEVLRGPQSTVQGRNALAGAVVLRTADPTHDWTGKGRLRMAEFGSQQFSGVVSGPIIADEIAFRFAADFQTTDGFIDNVATGESDDARENLLLRAKILVEPSQLPDLRAEFTVDYNDSTSSFSRLVAPVQANDPTFTSFDPSALETFGRPNSADLENIRILTDISYDLSSDITLQAIGTFEKTNSDESIGSRETVSLFRSAIETDVTTTVTYSAELRLQYDFGRWTGYVGAYYFRDDADRDLDFANAILDEAPIEIPLDPEDSIFGFTNSFTGETRNYALYAQTRFALNEDWIFDVSIRYDNEEALNSGVVTSNRFVDPASCVTTVPGFLVGLPDPIITAPCIDFVELLTPNANTPPQAASFDAFLPRATATYNISDNSSVFASFQRGYRAGGAFVQQTGGAVGVTVGTFDPEFLTNYEIGFRSQWLDNRLRVNGNFFFSIIDDQQVQIQGPSGNANDVSIENAGRSRLFGAELTADLRPADGLNFYGSIGLLDAEFRDFPFVQAPSRFENLAGNELANAPTVSFAVGGSYAHRSGFFGDLSLSYTGERQPRRNIENLGEAEFGPGVSELLEPLSILNARLGFEEENYTLYLFGTNLLNDSSSLNREFGDINPTTGELAFLPEPFFVLSRPRTFGLGVDFEL
ncbi:MAG: TonB-dependent receptor [Pseudomonadota bacterium]